MTTSEFYDRTVADWLREDAEHHVPDHLAEVLAQTRRTRQRPWWSSLERWLPMQATLRLAPVPRVAWLLVVLALVIGIAVAILATGSRPDLPAPFGPARNGALAYADHGDIFTVDPSTGVSTAIVTGPTEDGAPAYSRDGTRIAFLRSQRGDANHLYAAVALAQADGADVRVLTDPMASIRAVDWSPTGDRLVVISTASTGYDVLSIVDTASGEVTDLGLGSIVPLDWAAWRPTDGREVLFRGRPSLDSSEVGLYAVPPDGGVVRPVASPMPEGMYQRPRLTPDGRRITYSNWEPLAGTTDPDGWTHLLDLETGDDRQMHYDQFAAEVNSALSPDATHALIERQRIADDGTSPAQVILVSVDGSGSPITIGPEFLFQTPHAFGFSSDGQQVILTLNETTQIYRTSDGAAVSEPMDIPSYPDMQRLAP